MSMENCHYTPSSPDSESCENGCLGRSITLSYKKSFGDFHENVTPFQMNIKKNFFVIGLMGILSISTFNSVVYFALNFTQVINAVLMLAAIPPMIIIFSSIMKIENTNIFQLSGLLLSIFGVGTIISNADIQKIIS